LLNAVSGVMRVFAQTRSSDPGRSSTETSPANHRPLSGRALGLARMAADALTATPRARERLGAVRSKVRETASTASSTGRSARRRVYRRKVVLRLTTDRVLPLVIAVIVLAAAGVSLAPAAAPVGAAEPAAPAYLQGVRIAIGGGTGGPAEFDRGVAVQDMSELAAPVDDGTLYKPVAVDTSVKSAVGMLQHYTVKDGDTLTGIASRFGVSMMTVWWANKLTSKDSLKVGRDLVIPPVNGLIVTVGTGDTLDSLAAKNKIDPADILEVNQLDDPNLIVGQVLVLPGAKGEPIEVPKPPTRPSRPVSGSGGSSGPTVDGRGVSYQGGAWAWPVVGGGNYISQSFHYGHYGVDIAASYGSTIVAPLAGKVIFAGFRGNGGGYQVWLSLGNGLYTTEYHMSAVTVSAGQLVARGHRVGKIGMSGWATGPHVHLEVWVGVPWESGSYRVNPLRYY
jgi:murein DD-endopeptidase MepM/ murein hydrolase activator NlpD